MIASVRSLVTINIIGCIELVIFDVGVYQIKWRDRTVSIASLIPDPFAEVEDCDTYQ